MCISMKIKSTFWLFLLKKNKRNASLVIKVDDVKVAKTPIEENFVSYHTLYGYIRYNLTCSIKQCFNFY